MNIARVKHIFIKDLYIEFRQKFAIGGIFLFAATVVYLIYKSFNEINAREWSILIWVILLFAGLNAVVKSFLQEKRETYVYYYTLFDPLELMIAKLVYNFIFLCCLFVIILTFMALLNGYPVKDHLLFFTGSGLGILGIAIVFSFVSLVSTSDANNSTLMSILALPLVLPIVLLLLKISAVSIRLMVDTAVYEDVMILFGIDCLLLGAVVILFPEMWRS